MIEKVKSYGTGNFDICALGPNQQYYARLLDGSWSCRGSNGLSEAIRSLTTRGCKIRAISLGFGESFLVSFELGNGYLDWKHDLQGHYSSLDRFLKEHGNIIVSAAPKADTTPKNTYFQGLALRSASPVHFNYLQANKESFELKLKNQDSSCMDGKKHNEAYLQLYGDELFLYASGNPRQQAYVDFSGMGQGKFGYTTGAQPAPKNASRKGWKIDKDGLLTCDGASFVACPMGDDLEKTSWSVWVYNSIDNPGGNKNCLPFSVKAAELKKPADCQYSAIQPSN
ncbi:hypothetical protein ACHAPU_003333 [Fusarium lateritium]